MRTPEQEYARQVRRRASDKWNALGIRGVVTRNRSLESDVHTTQVYVRSGDPLRVWAAEADGGPKGAATEDIGRLIFVPGYSDPDSGEFIPDS